MVAPRLSSGQEVPLMQWNKMQADRSQEWEITRGMEANQRLMVWAQFFARLVGALCKERGVPVDVFDEAYPEFADRLIPHIDNLKWLQSETERHDLGLEETAKRIRWRIHDAVNGEMRVVAMFPNVNDPTAVHEETMILRVNDRQGA